MKLLAFASLTSAMAMSAFGMWQVGQQELDAGIEEEYEMYLISCSEDRRAVHGITFDYEMRDTCIRILDGKEVL